MCYDGFSAQTADVVCKGLGFAGGIPLYNTDVPAAAASQAVVLDNVICSGSEASIDACQLGVLGDSGGCDHSTDAGVWCATSTATLTGGATAASGLLQLKLSGGAAAPVCSVGGFSDVSATVACQQVNGQRGGPLALSPMPS